MKIENACVECIIGQTQRVADAIGADDALREKIRKDVLAMSNAFDFAKSPPEVAREVYEHLAVLAGKKDLYDEVKRHSSEKAKTFIPFLREQIAKADDPFLTAVKVAVAGNVIDLAAEVSFDLDTEIDKLFHTHFAHDDVDALRQRLSGAKTLLYIGDNAGEHLFDALAIEAVAALYPQLAITYMTRGKPIINDVTFDEAMADGLAEVATLVDSGVDTPGFVYERASEEARRLFDESDVVLTKGMGNYECLSPSPRGDLVYLLKVKCNVVSRSIGAEIGSIICKLV
ncbi:ARMT1-like domain-containing protein [Sulfurimonas sp. HSL-3221]|uniref:damage-control phosphatase ARMT1 family protein n=1 Tax=Sulfurimonadaceae TaxID=2771471 RepID=UPI001E4866C0|nr:ARMT1-like domain-containing protein [Sulfurimonas sp. HSL-3221]UFS62957.1 ARMT1-like domain-containing protein [Sulfurimonas sp. HSL-3221]